MPRGSFNTTADFYDGPETPSGGVFRFAGDIRFVSADGITWVDAGIPPVVGWITVDASKPFGGWDPVTQVLRPGLGDSVAIPAGSALQFFVLVVDEVLWGGQPLYYRAHVAYEPRPVPPGPTWVVGTSPLPNNQIVVGAPPGPAPVLPGMRVYNQNVIGYVNVLAVALPIITVSVILPVDIVPSYWFFD